MKRKFLIVFLSFICFTLQAYAKNYKLDKAHTKVGFNITHLIFNTMDGRFKKFMGNFEYDEKSETLKNVKVVITAKSISTEHKKRDTHLRSPDFFNVKKYPTIVYELKQAKVKIGEETIVRGTLNMHGVKREVPMRLTLMGPISDPWGNSMLIFKLWGSLKRSDFKISWNESLKGKIKGMLIGEIVDLKITGEAK